MKINKKYTVATVGLMMVGLIVLSGVAGSAEAAQRRGGDCALDSNVTRSAIRTAVENSDYNAWVAAIGDRPINENINSDNFSKLVQAHNLRMSGDYEAARDIMMSLGIDRYHKAGNGFGHHGLRNRN